MIKFEKSIYIERSPEDVFEHITDPAKSSAWQSGIVSAAWSSNSPVSVGSTWKTMAKFMGRDIEAELQVTGWEPPRLVSFKSISGPIPMEVTNNIEAQGDGTLLTTIGQVEFSGFLKLAEGVAGMQVEKQLDGDNQKLKMLMESNQL